MLEISRYLRETGVGDLEHGEVSVTVDELRENIPDYKDIVLDGHLAHLVELDRCVVLRTSPGKLRARLQSREYSSEKIDENVEAEAMDLILSEAIEMQDCVYEIDTSDKSPSEIAEEVMEFVESGNPDYGKVDWSNWF
jgi:Predicted nucleotide kinase (related to CMP and AMP kinases)